ncbi:MAG: YgiT-type zinc finger protein [Acidobacteriota bacterium]
MAGRFGYMCEYCGGTVREKRLDREAFKHRDGLVILKDVVIGVCDKCGNRYYSADTIKQVQAIATGKKPPEHTEEVPVSHAG